MQVQAIEPPAAPARPPQVVQIRKLELFIVPLAENERVCFEVHLLLSTNTGPLTSEWVLEACDKPSDWVIWSYGFRKMLNAKQPCDAYELARRCGGNSVYSHLARAALQQLIGKEQLVRADRRTSLMERASQYVCLF
ncbi:hypothetical protein [Cohnella sp. GCM10012308]|uniref:hypothetical protein n=1 Tax=Cohnella sp. GCM10012308 TaxID=3317329 RepID=UPI00360BD37D